MKPDQDVILSGLPDKMKERGDFTELQKNVMNSVPGRAASFGGNGNEHMRNMNEGVEVNVSEERFVLYGYPSDSSMRGEDSVSKKRKREPYLSTLNWITSVARDPCDPCIGQLPERHRWKHYGSDLQWKKILSVREAMRLNRIVDATSQQSIWQNKQKMHPSMYDDQSVPDRVRCSQRLIIAKDSSRKTKERIGSESSSSGSQSDQDFKQSDLTAGTVGYRSGYGRRKRLRVGEEYQADVPEFSKGDYECDSKWLGTKTWPLDKGEYNSSLIERDRIGKGRQESCGCQIPGSPECVRFHIGEKRMKVKLELGPAFDRWKVGDMGEEVALSWTKEDEAKFEEIVKSNRLSSEKYFWEELFKFFPHKGREALVSYYFNVFLLRRRGHQNRNSGCTILSDDEDSAFGPIGNRFGQVAATSPGSIFCSPKKSHLNSR